MSFNTLSFLILAITAVCIIAAEELPESNQVVDRPHRQSRLNNFLHLLLQNGPVCTGCPQRYCDADPGIILGYCCGCRRAYDVLPVFCSPTIFCPAYMRDVCHDYEYMLHCCC